MSTASVRLFAAATLAATVASGPSRAADAPTSPEPYFSHPDMAAVRVSPSGRRIAALAPVNGRVALVVMDTDKRLPRVAARMEAYDISWFEWVNDKRLVFGMIDLQVGSAEQRRQGLYAVDHDGADAVALHGGLGRGVRLHSTLDDGSDDIIALGIDRDEKIPDVHRVNTRTNRGELLTWDPPPQGNPRRWVVDRKGAVRAALTVERGTLNRSWWRAEPGAKWQLIGEHATDRAGVLPVAFDGDGSLIVESNHGRDTFALYRFDAAKDARGELLAAHPQVDLRGGLVWDPVKQRIVGLHYDGAKPGQAWFDDDWAKLAATIDRALPGRFNTISRGHANHVLVTSSSDRDPGTWYLLDVATRKLEFLAARRKAIRPDDMPDREPLRYRARDGLEIPAYLTLPRGREAKALPLVLYVHGGPFVRGASWTWSATPAWLAAQGYAVLEPEFRGSTGWGGTLFRKGWQQWGRGMQDDLLDGIDFLAARGTVDPARVCIMGGSYGGYAVMMGLARDPQRFRCGVNYIGVTDIELLFDVTWSDTFNSEFMQFTAKQLIGDPELDAGRLREVSPLANAAKIKAPVMMAYGSSDRRVPLVHGERMRDALRAQGTPVEWVAYAGEGHGFLRETNRYDFYSRVQRFLAQHLK